MKPAAGFLEALISVHRESPCQVLPTALLKSVYWGKLLLILVMGLI
jgi:hypothetical protein